MAAKQIYSFAAKKAPSDQRKKMKKKAKHSARSFFGRLTLHSGPSNGAFRTVFASGETETGRMQAEGETMEAAR